MGYSPNAILSAATDRDFEHAVLPFLNIMYPRLVQAVPRGHWDKRGIDLITDATEDPIDCCIQCKGFVIRHLGPDQYRDILKSIEKFAKSGLKCRMYAVVHNRDSRLRDYEERLADELARLVQSGAAETAVMWDRRTPLKTIEQYVNGLVRAKVAERSKNSLEQLETIYGSHWAWQPRVPMSMQRLAFRRDEPARLVSKSEARALDVTEALLGQDNTRWTMVVGHFGVGKTSATVLAAHAASKTVIRAECARFHPANLNGGMNALTKEIMRSLQLRPPSAECQRQFEYYAGRELSRILRRATDDVVLIIDGLDENIFYSRRQGFVHLTNQLADVACPILLVTRRAHFDERFGDLSTAFFDLSLKNGPKRQAVVIELGFWTDRGVTQFLEMSAGRFTGEERARVLGLLDLVQQGHASAYYGTLLTHPLFLSFILDDVVSDGIRRASRSELILNWVTRKIFRDRGVERIDPSPAMDTMKFASKMIELMEDAAILMTRREESRLVLIESISEEVLSNIADQKFSAQIDVVLGVLLNSVMVSGEARSIGKPLPIMFSHRVFQEYFLARAFSRKGSLQEGCPVSVKSFFDELQLSTA